MTRLLALAVMLVLLLGTAPASGKVHELYALRYGAKANVLTPYDPVRLVPSGTAIRLGRFAHSWSISPDRRHFAAAAGVRRKGEAAAVRVVDLEHGRVEGTVSLPGELGRVTATAWIRGRLLVVVSASDSTRLYAVDPSRRMTVGMVELAGAVVLGERAQNKLVLLLAPPGRIGPATVAVVDQSPRARTVVLDKTAAGTATSGTGGERRMTVRRPALTLAPSGRRAYVLGGGEPPASIDLRTLTVRYAPVRGTTAAAKRGEGSVRTAATLSDGRIVLGGYELGARRSRVPLSLVDPRDWSRRTLSTDGSWFRVEGGLVFTRGENGLGLRIRRPSGAVVDLFRTGAVARVTVIGPRALVTFFGTNVKAAVVDLSVGRVRRHTVPTYPVVGAGQPIIG